jgi:hypothetical protein
VVICRGPVTSFPFTSTDIVAPRIRCVKEIGGVCARVCHIYCDVEPLSGLGPANVGRVGGGTILSKGLSSIGSGFRLNFRVGSIHSLMDTEFVEIGPISRIQLSAAVILWIGAMIRNSFAAQVIPSARDLSRYFLWTATIAGAVIRQAFILAQE